MRRLLIAGLFLAVLSPGKRAAAQAWPQPPGEHYIALRGGYLLTDTEYNYQGEEQPLFAEDPARTDVSYRELYVDGYLEYGLARRFTLVANVAFKNVRTEETIQLIAGLPGQKAIRTNYGLSDLWVMLRTPVIQRRVVLSTQYGIKLPLGYDVTPENQGPPLGTGEVDFDFGVYAGASITPASYTQAGAGYRVRGGDFNDEWWFGAEAGGTWKQAFGKLRVEGVRNTEDPVDIAGQIVETPLPGGVLNTVIVGNQDFTKLIASGAFRLAEEWSVTLEAYHVLSGTNTLAGTTFVVGLVSQSR